MQKVINCPCGFVLKGDSDDEVVQKAQAHAKQVHQMDLSREQALAIRAQKVGLRHPESVCGLDVLAEL